MKRHKVRIFLWRISFFLVAGVFLFLVTGHMTEKQAYFVPDYEQVDLESVFGDEHRLSAADYDLIYHQTGLGKVAVKSLLSDAENPGADKLPLNNVKNQVVNESKLGDEDGIAVFQGETALLKKESESLLNDGSKEDMMYWTPQVKQQLSGAQEHFFTKPQLECTLDNWIVSREQTVDKTGKIIRGNHLDYLEDGDILVTNASHIGGWRNGHAAIVVDAEKKKTLEAITIFEDSALRNVSKWEKYPNVVVLRLTGATPEQRRQVADWARENMMGKPYRITAGILSDEGTQCAHLIWQAYMEFGYDLDSNGGLVVTPKQLANSPLLEIVQVYGMNPDSLWE